MALNPTTFRRSALAATVIAGASILASFPAAAQEAKGSPACTQYQGDAASHAQCEYNALGRRIQDVKRQGAEADNEGACMESLITMIKSGPTGKDRVKTALGGKSFHDVRHASFCQR